MYTTMQKLACMTCALMPNCCRTVLLVVPHSTIVNFAWPQLIGKNGGCRAPSCMRVLKDTTTVHICGLSWPHRDTVNGSIHACHVALASHLCAFLYSQYAPATWRCPIHDPCTALASLLMPTDLQTTSMACCPSMLLLRRASG